MSLVSPRYAVSRFNDRRMHVVSAVIRLCCLLSALILISSSCSRPFSLAVGPAGDITVFTTLPDDDAGIVALVQGLGREMVFLRPEPSFKVEIGSKAGFNAARRWRNLVLVGSLDEGSWVSDMIEGMLDEEGLRGIAEGRRNVFLVQDKWALGQLMVIVACTRADDLGKAINDNVDGLYRIFERAAIDNTREILLRKDVQRDRADCLQRRYGWKLILPKGYEAIENPERQVAIFRTEGPSRIVLVHWRDGYGEKLGPEDCLMMRAELAWNCYDEDLVDRDMTRIERTVFLGRDVIRITGIWQNEKHVSGGPFRTYCFLDGSRLYMIDLVVFAPSTDKLPYLRELEAIAGTFATS